MKFVYKRFASGIERPIIPIAVRNPVTGQAVRTMHAANKIDGEALKKPRAR
jgi:hypothetical protein